MYPPIEKVEGKGKAKPDTNKAKLLFLSRKKAVHHLIMPIGSCIFTGTSHLQAEDHASSGPQATKKQRVPLQLDPHPEDGEGGGGHP